MNLKMKLGMSAGAVITVLSATTMFAHADALTRQLQMGMTGSDVGTLQVFLAKDASIYPEGKVTNYFWTLTQSAVMRFQAKNGISTVGRVGPQTLSAINAQMLGGVSSNSIAPTISSVYTNINSNSATISWNTDEAALGAVYYSTSPLSVYENDNSVTVTSSHQTAMTDSSLKTSQSIYIPNLQANTTYYYMINTTDASGNVTVSVPNTFRIN